ncbi:MAG: lytic transglycosylase domain-containing protein [Acidobacteria bacterium]|nr:lytic transglycosylase domain-containing protein [Acidobacteriota bacterium]
MYLRSTILVTLVLAFLSSASLWADSMGSSVDKTGPKVFTNMGKGQKATGADLRTGYISLINEWAPRYNLDAHLVEAVVAVESNYDRFAVSKKGAQGLMQLIPATAKRFGVRDAFDPADNIRGGIRYLNFLMSYFQGNLEHVLAAYNAGERTVVRYHGVPPYPETQEYIRKVTSLYHALNSVAAPAPVKWPRGKFRLKRIILPNGNILFTNTE